MYKKFKTIREDQQAKATPTPPLKTIQKNQSQQNKLTDKRTDSATPKDNSSVFSAKPEPNRGAGDDRKPSIAKPHITRPTMEEAGAVSVGSGAVAGITDPTTNYAFQAQKKKFEKIARRKKPVKEEFEAGIGNTQINPDTKKTPVKLSTMKERGIKANNKKTAAPPTAPSGGDTSPPIGGQ